MENNSLNLTREALFDFTCPSPQRSSPYTLKKHIDNLEALLESLRLDNITLAMHDWGGAIGMGYAIRHPEKIKRLIIFNTAAFLCSRMDNDSMIPDFVG